MWTTFRIVAKPLRWISVLGQDCGARKVEIDAVHLGAPDCNNDCSFCGFFAGKRDLHDLQFVAFNQFPGEGIVWMVEEIEFGFAEKARAGCGTTLFLTS
jgi:hypothetical protein